MKWYTDKRINEMIIEVFDMTFLYLQSCKQTTMSFKGKRKLSPRFFGLYKILQLVGQVVYKLELSVDPKIHIVFHVSCLKKKLGKSIIHVMELSMTRKDGQLQFEPIFVLGQRVVKRNRRPSP